jgi:hypothetical protein
MCEVHIMLFESTHESLVIVERFHDSGWNNFVTRVSGFGAAAARSDNGPAWTRISRVGTAH